MEFSMIQLKKKEIENSKNIKNNNNNKNIGVETKIIKALKNRKFYSNCEIFRSSYYLICGNQQLKKNNKQYKLANENICMGTDYLEIIKLNRDFKVLKYLVLNNIQQKVLDLIGNLKLGENKFYDLNENSEILNVKDTNETLKIIKKYYERGNGIDKIDKKLYHLIHPKIRKIIEDIEN
jgi:hypothetical protein